MTSAKKSKKATGGFRKLAAKARAADPDAVADGLPDIDHELPPAEGVVKKSKTGRPSAMDAIVRAAFHAAASPADRRRLAHVQALAAAIIVPTAAWIRPVADLLRESYGDRFVVVTRDGASKAGGSGDNGSLEAASALSRGRCVLGIAPRLDLLPPALSGGADLVVTIRPPDGAVLGRAIAQFAGRKPGDLPAGLAAGLDLTRIVAAFRPGSGPADIVKRLGIPDATVAGGDVPDLETAVEYGAARDWGLDLARDIADFRAGRIGWESVDRGICLHSPPGMGKTLYAQILARACGVPLVSTSVAEWFAAGPGYLDSVIKAARAAFAAARASANPCCILHIDELDALPNRATMSGRGRDWWLPVITDILLQLDSTVSSRSGVIVLGTTNLIDQVDAALLRPGRLEKVVEVAAPDAAGALNILRFHVRGDVLDRGIDHLGALLAGSSGADIMLVVRKARRAARHAGRALGVADLEAAALPPSDLTPAVLRRIAIHEAAHAVTALAIGSGTVDAVTLRAEGTSGGRTIVSDSRDDLESRATIEDRVVVGLAARAAESLLCGAASTGGGGSPRSDLGSATALIASLHVSYGLGESLAFMGAAGDEAMRELALDPGMRDRVERHLRILHDRAAAVVAANRSAILAVAEALAARRHLSGADVEALVAGLLVREVRPAPG
jgi:hypothetical protein